MINGIKRIKGVVIGVRENDTEEKWRDREVDTETEKEKERS